MASGPIGPSRLRPRTARVQRASPNRRRRSFLDHNRGRTLASGVSSPLARAVPHGGSPRLQRLAEARVIWRSGRLAAFRRFHSTASALRIEERELGGGRAELAAGTSPISSRVTWADRMPPTAQSLTGRARRLLVVPQRGLPSNPGTAAPSCSACAQTARPRPTRFPCRRQCAC